MTTIKRGLFSWSLSPPRGETGEVVKVIFEGLLRGRWVEFVVAFTTLAHVMNGGVFGVFELWIKRGGSGRDRLTNVQSTK